MMRSQTVIAFRLDGTILGANANFLNAQGYELEEIVGKHHSMFCEPAYTSTAEYVMTQQAATLVEQTNAAIEQTEAQASELDAIVAVFKLERIVASWSNSALHGEPRRSVTVAA